jgi:hypothetical protein
MRDADMPNNAGPLREIAWQEVFPWLLLVRAFRVSIQVSQLLLAAAGVLLTIIGWWGLAQLFGGTGDDSLKVWLGPAYYASSPWNELDDWPWRPTSAASDIDARSLVLQAAVENRLRGLWQLGPPQLGRYPSDPFPGAWRQLGAPIRQLFDGDVGVTGLAFLLCACVWAAAVWALFGGAITRRAALQLGREENLSLKASLRYAAGKWRSYFAAPLLPLFGILCCALPIFVLGFLMWFDLGVLLAGIVWPLALLASFLMALLLLALLFGWPLMWPTISTEGTDSFDALSRSWSYVYHRPLHYLFYSAVVTMLGGLGWLLVTCFADWVVYLPLWAARWTTGGDRMREILRGADSLGTIGHWGANLIYFWNGCVRLLAIGFVYSYFWTASTAIYFLLRRDDDGTDLDDVHLDPAEASYGLPPLAKDAAGVPVVPESEMPTTEAHGQSSPPAHESAGDGGPPAPGA